MIKPAGSPDAYKLSDDGGGFPNSPLPVLVYHELETATEAGACERLFADHGWRGAWRDGIYPFHHFHANAHEVLGIVAGSAAVMLGGPDGRRLDVSRGDVLVLPAGTSHCRLDAERLLVVGAYPGGIDWDLRRGDPAERAQVLASIATVPLPDADPVSGTRGPLTRCWR